MAHSLHPWSCAETDSHRITKMRNNLNDMVVILLFESFNFIRLANIDMVSYVTSKVKIALLALIVIGTALFITSIVLDAKHKKGGMPTIAIGIVALMVGIIGKAVYGNDSNHIDKDTKLGFLSTKIGILTPDEKNKLKQLEMRHSIG